MKNNDVNCPPLGAISDWMEGLVAKDSAIDCHIRNCPQCAETIAILRRLDGKVHHYLAEQSPALNTAAAALSIRRKITATPKCHPLLKFVMQPAVFATAACVAILGIGVMATGYWTNAPLFEGKHGPITDSPELNPTFFPAANVSANDVQTVSFTHGNTQIDPKNFYKFTDPEVLIEAPVTIPPNVTHNWIVKDFESVQGLINKAQTLGNKIDAIEKDASGVTFEIIGTPHQIIEVVRTFAGMGAALISPNAPQPEDRNFTNTSDMPIVYTVKFFFKTPPTPLIPTH